MASPPHPPTTPSPHPLTVAIMAGGKSSRMGADKSFVPLLGKPLIEHVLERVAGLGQETILITNKPTAYRYLGLPLFGDIYPDCGPLGGLHAALKQAQHTHVLVAACDMPWLNRPFLEYMLSLRAQADVVIPRWLPHPEPLHAVYNRRCLAPIEANLQAGRFKMIGFFEQVTVHYVERAVIKQFDENGRSFANINTPNDLAAAA